MNKNFLIGLFLLILMALPVAAQQNQDEIILKTLGRAPLASACVSTDDARRVLKQHSEEVGKALEQFPGGEIGEQIFVRLYENIDVVEFYQTEIPIGQKLEWMIYKGGLIKKVKWQGDYSFLSFCFKIEVEDGTAIFVIPARCGNISLMKFLPKEAVSFKSSSTSSAEDTIVLSPMSQFSEQSSPMEIHPWLWPAIKIKIGGGWTKVVAGSNFIKQLDFTTLIPENSSLFYCENGTASWYYTPKQETPFKLGQHLDIYNNIVSELKRKKEFPFFIGIEIEILNNLYLSGDYFYVGKFDFSSYEKKGQMIIDELRFLGSYPGDNTNDNKTYVYYLGLHREYQEKSVQEVFRILEWSAGLKYSLLKSKQLLFSPEAGLNWQIKKGDRISQTSISTLYPFKERSLKKENNNSVEEKIEKIDSYPYLGISLEFASFQLEGRYLFLGESPIIPGTTSWQISLALKF